MEKKPVRVTNEELNMLEEMSDAEVGEKMGLVKFIRKLSADLLDARELIDKQEALVKEMREEIGQLALTYAGGGVEAVCNNILEQTKDYAE